MAQVSECSHRTIAEWSALEAERDRLLAENEALKAEVASHRAMAMERDDFLYRIGKISREYEDRLAELSGAVDETDAPKETP